MLSIMLSIIGIIITILFVVGVHEFGHFIVAKMCGIKVLKFSIGFGKSFARWHDKQGTEYVLAYIPLGGYVQMLDENEAPVPEDQKKFTYNSQPYYKKVAVVVAGPLFNLLFAFIIYWCLFVVGFVTVAPKIGNVAPKSIASVAGLKPNQEIMQIDGKPTRTWLSVIINVLMRAGETNNMQIEVKNLSGPNQIYTLPLQNWKLDNLRPDPLKSLGIIPYEPNVPNIVGKMLPDSPAKKGGLKEGDVIISIENKPTKNWQSIVENIVTYPLQTLSFTVMRNNKKMVIPVKIGERTHYFAKSTGFLGMGPQFKLPDDLLITNKYGPVEAVYYAWQDVMLFVRMNFLVLGKMITGKISLASLGGPISIFETAGDALNNGVMAFMSFLAFLSISIGVINILPIPGLDGGHLLFQSIEAIMRRPIAERTQVLMFKLGLILLILVMFQALVNDILRL